MKKLICIIGLMLSFITAIAQENDKVFYGDTLILGGYHFVCPAGMYDDDMGGGVYHLQETVTSDEWRGMRDILMLKTTKFKLELKGIMIISPGNRTLIIYKKDKYDKWQEREIQKQKELEVRLKKFESDL